MEKPEQTRASAAELATKTIDNHNLRAFCLPPAIDSKRLGKLEGRME
jgi:hypothetical protein